MDDDLARQLARVTVLLGAILAVLVLTLFAVAGVSIIGLAAAFVVVGLLVALFGRLVTDWSPFRGRDRIQGR